MLAIMATLSITNAENTINAEDIIINNSADLNNCGLLTTAENSSGFMVNPLDASICQRDISMIVLYFIFGEAIDKLPTFDGIITIPEGVRQTARNVGVGQPIMMIFRLMSLLVFAAATIFILFNSISNFLRTNKDGEFLNKKHDNTATVKRLLITFVALAPVGLLSVIQILVLVVSVLSITGGNFVWSNFLNFVQVKSIEINANDELEKEIALSMSNTLIQSELCSVRTGRKLFNDNIMNMNADFETVVIQSNNWFAQSVNWIANISLSNGWNNKTALSLNDKLARYDACMTPANIITQKEAPSFSSLPPLLTGVYRGNVDECRDNSFVYYDEWYGEEYNCGGITYNYTDLSDVLTNGESNVERRRANNLVLISANNFKNVISRADEYNAIKGMESTIREQFERTGEIDILNPELQELYNPVVDSLKDKIKEQITNMADGNEVFNNNVELKQHSYYLYHQYALNFLLGGVYEREQMVNGSENTPYGYAGYNGITKSERPQTYEKGYFNDVLKTFVMPAADYLEQAHCAENWKTMRNSRKTVNIINNNLDNKDHTQLEFDMECVDIINENGNFTAQYNTIDSEHINADQGLENLGDTEKALKADVYHKTVAYNQMLNEAAIKQYQLALWFYVAKKAVIDSIGELNKESADDIIPSTMRQEGWGSAGGYMLKVAMNQQSGSSAYKRLNDNISWRSTITDFDSNYINNDAFDENETLENKEEEKAAKFGVMTLNKFLFESEFKNIGQNTTKVNEELDGLAAFIRVIENFITKPMDYLELMAGADSTDGTLREQVDKCSAQNDCKIGETHPLNALMQFGHESISTSITLMITSLIVSEVVETLDTDNHGTIMKTVSGVFNKSPLGKFINGILQTVNVVLEMLMPFVYIMLFVGVLFAYIVPTLPYVAFLVMFISWILLVITSMLTLPVMMVLYGSTTDDGQSSIDVNQIFKALAHIALKPALIVIGLIVGWSIASISVYVVNVTAFASGVGATLMSGGGLINSTLGALMDVIMFYAMYIIIIMIVLQHAYKVINTLPDAILKRLGINDAQDSEILDSLGFERMLQANALQGGIKNGYSSAKNIQKKRQAERKQKMKQIRNEEEQKNRQKGG